MSGFGMPLTPGHTEESGGLAIGLKVQRAHLSTLDKELPCLSYRALRPGPLRASATEVTGDWKPSSSQDQSAFTCSRMRGQGDDNVLDTASPRGGSSWS